jgi:hypothetical protein
MSCWINAEIFDHAVLYSSVKWTVGSVMSFIEELKLVCPNKTLTQSKWVDVTVSKMTVSESQIYWSVFMACRQSIQGQVGEWIDLTTVGILLLCQAYANARARADSFQRSEAMVHTLATTMAVPLNPTSSQSARTHRSTLITNSSRLVRDNAGILQFTIESIPLFVAMTNVCNPRNP